MKKNTDINEETASYDSNQKKRKSYFYDLKGTCGLLFARADMTSPSAERDLLIFWVSFNRSP